MKAALGAAAIPCPPRTTPAPPTGSSFTGCLSLWHCGCDDSSLGWDCSTGLFYPGSFDFRFTAVLTSGGCRCFFGPCLTYPADYNRSGRAGLGCKKLQWICKSWQEGQKKEKRINVTSNTCVCCSRKQENTTIKCNTWARTQLQCSNPFCKAHSNLSSVQIYQTGKLFSFKGELHPFYPLSNKALPAKHSSPDEENQSSAKTTARLLER